MNFLVLNTIMRRVGEIVPKILPIANFTGSPTTISQGGTVNYTDTSTVPVGGTPITSWLWTFEGGTPATSTLQNPTGITYATDGTFDVSLKVTNADGSNTKTVLDYITVNAYVPPVTINSFNIGPWFMNIGEYQNTDFQIGTFGIKVN